MFNSSFFGKFWVRGHLGWKIFNLYCVLIHFISFLTYIGFWCILWKKCFSNCHGVNEVTPTFPLTSLPRDQLCCVGKSRLWRYNYSSLVFTWKKKIISKKYILEIQNRGKTKTKLLEILETLIWQITNN